jgi:hypothetical protein
MERTGSTCAIVLSVGIIAVLVSCAGGPPEETAVRAVGEGGTTSDDAIRILGAKTIMESIAAENAWLARHYPGSYKRRQTLVATLDGNQRCDVIQIVTATGRELEIWFDISEVHATTLE